jgi:hypothetical protein
MNAYFRLLIFVELVFTEIILQILYIYIYFLLLQILYWVYEIAVHNRVCILDLPTTIVL